MCLSKNPCNEKEDSNECKAQIHCNIGFGEEIYLFVEYNLVVLTDDSHIIAWSKHWITNSPRIG